MSLDKMREIDRKIAVHAKIEPLLSDLRSLVRHRSGDMLRQSRKGLESAIASLEAALQAEKSAGGQKFYAEAEKGQLAPKRILRAVE